MLSKTGNSIKWITIPYRLLVASRHYATFGASMGREGVKEGCSWPRGCLVMVSLDLTNKDPVSGTPESLSRGLANSCASLLGKTSSRFLSDICGGTK
jgi:hypothetical protein